tara:strand:- start:1969 stop:2862 length:894 start_codon:yes stop_codon:yes gene_type:complete
MPTSINGASGGGVALPTTPAAALLDAAHPFELVNLGAGGVGSSVTVNVLAGALVTPNLALRRYPADASTAMLWECNEAASPLASTGSVACNLVNQGAATFNFTDPLPSLDGTCVHFTGAATSEVRSAAGIYPDAATSTLITMWAVINIHTMPTGFAAGAILCRDFRAPGDPWADPYCTAIFVRASGVLAGTGAFGAVPTYDDIASSAGVVVVNKQHLVGLTYDGTNLRIWVDGVRAGNKAVASPLTWGSAGTWHLGSSGNNDLFNGVVIRAGVETVAWDRADWALAYRRLTGTTSNL